MLSLHYKEAFYPRSEKRTDTVVRTAEGIITVQIPQTRIRPVVPVTAGYADKRRIRSHASCRSHFFALSDRSSFKDFQIPF